MGGDGVDGLRGGGDGLVGEVLGLIEEGYERGRDARRGQARRRLQIDT